MNTETVENNAIKKQAAVRLSPSVWVRVRVMAARREKSAPTIIEEAILQYLEREEPKEST